MKYMLMMNAPGKTPYQIFSWPKPDIEAHIAFMMGFAKKLAANGELVSAEGLAGPDQARLVRGGPNGEPVTDGVFPETKEFSGRLLDHRRGLAGAGLRRGRRSLDGARTGAERLCACRLKYGR